MEKNIEKIAQLIEEQISFIFENFKALPNYGQPKPTFIAQPRQSDTFDKIKGALEKLKSSVTIENFGSSGNAHLIHLDKDTRIAIIYAKDSEDFKWLYDFYSYSHSIIIGKILKRAGLKYSEDGLQYLQHDLRENHKSVVGTIDISKDISRILQVLELDPQEFKNGFKTIEEFFNYVIKSPYLNAAKFSDPTKEQKNITLQKFEEYIILNGIETSECKDLTFDRVKECFPEIDFGSRIAELIAKAERKKTITDKFSGRVIMDSIPGFNQKQLGIAMGYFKHSFPTKELFEEFMTEHTVEEFIVKFKEVNQIS